jgi:hypothetical protein
MSNQPQPTERDYENFAIRDAIARKQAEEYGHCMRLAAGYAGLDLEPGRPFPLGE